MQPDDDGQYTYNEISNDDKELLLRNGYRPGELTPNEARDLLADLREDDDDDDSGKLSNDVSADERDGTE
ncbi:MAG: hypothetical protein WDN27_05640 [Candidatus Saccharibacteria bacterium]